MVNLHLLTKISGFDSEYRKQITQLIAAQAEKVSDQVLELLRDHKWAYCQVILERYIHDIQPYCQPSFTESLIENLDGFAHTDEPAAKEMICKHILNSIRNNLILIMHQDSE
ncbi:MAG: hypothetical protein RL226_1328 [Bacteroidota bacterium]